MVGYGANRSELEIGMSVEINPKADRTREKRIEGEISEILTGSLNHTHGILVRLVSGEIGRVKTILSTTTKILGLEPFEKAMQTINEIIDNGENNFVEFKSSMLWSERLSPENLRENSSQYTRQYGRDASKAVVASSIAGFLNADGGDLVIGIKENKNTQDDEVIGIESEYSKLKDPCVDGYRRKILDSIIKPYFPSNIFHHFNKYLTIVFPKINDKTLCRIIISKSDEKVFININKIESFYVRIDASTRQLKGEDVVNYCMKRFN